MEKALSPDSDTNSMVGEVMLVVRSELLNPVSSSPNVKLPSEIDGTTVSIFTTLSFVITKFPA